MSKNKQEFKITYTWAKMKNTKHFIDFVNNDRFVGTSLMKMFLFVTDEIFAHFLF